MSNEPKPQEFERLAGLRLPVLQKEVRLAFSSIPAATLTSSMRCFIATVVAPCLSVECSAALSSKDRMIRMDKGLLHSMKCVLTYIGGFYRA